MDTSTTPSFSRHADIFSASLSLDDVRRKAPAVFAESAHERTSASYAFVPTDRILNGLMRAGFVPVEARQTKSRYSTLHARHVIRLRRRVETIQLRDSVPEIICLNSHDTTSSVSLRGAIFRVVCLKGLIASVGSFPSIRVPHRGDIVVDVVVGALEMAEQFGVLAGHVERMEQRLLCKEEQIAFAERALRLRYPDPSLSGMESSQLLTCRRTEDLGSNLWVTLNKVEENLVSGGLSRRSASGRMTRSRRITSIREDVRIHSGLWDLAAEALAA
jgi:hypothetical protein